MRPLVIGGETEYGIFTNDFNDSSWSSVNAAHEVVRAISQLNMSFVDRGLEQIETIEEHELAEEEARNQWTLEPENLLPVPLFDIHSRFMPFPRSSSESGALRQRRGISGYVLQTGARYYVDMGHPEYSTPETLSPYTIVLVQKAGDLIVEECRKIAQLSMRQRTGNPDFTIRLHRNNSDGKGSSYAGHENYSLTPDTFEKIVHYEKSMMWCPNHRRMESTYAPGKGMYTDFVLKFFVTRQIITDAGKVGSETQDYVPYQISSRADFMMEEVGHSTVAYRPIINTRDQPLAAYKRLRRLHVICGDSNVSELSIYLKFGITALFFQMLEAGLIQASGGNLAIPLTHAVGAYHAVSRDLTLRKKLSLINGDKMSALETQVLYCQMAKAFVAASLCDPVWTDVVEKWEGVLQGLDGNRAKHELSKNLDWVMKERLLAIKQKKHGIEPTHEACYDLALSYHDTNPEVSIAHSMLQEGKMMRIVREDEIIRMTRRAPSDTRAWFRGELLQRYAQDVIDIGWDYAEFKKDQLIYMEDPRHCTEAQIRPFLQDNPSLAVLLSRLKKASEDGIISGITTTYRR
ncbi:MAG: proteasome accessory factor PafA2 family protein [bacterium]|nr:proteasome accessory factor PafA2 family protein [bacterium]MDZ4286118.1 proteasome accessory factor PafA2 family protein [Candidatus Sungbacteria bacterium]